MYLPASEASSSSCPASSSASAQRPSGTLLTVSWLVPGSDHSRRVSLVRTQPGARQLTRTPSGAASTARVRVMPISPALAAPYTPMPGLAERPATLATLTIAPPRGMRGRAALHARKGPRRLRFMTLSHPAVRVSARAAKNCWPPATLTSTSSWPERSAARATSASTAASSAASVGATTASGAPARRAAAATRSRSPAERAASTSPAPASAQVRAACSPMPLLAPMIRTVLPSRRNLASSDMASAVPPPPPPHAGLPELGEVALPAGPVPVAALLRAALGPHHHVQRAREDLLVAAGAAVGLEGAVRLHHAQVPAVRHPLERQRLAAEPRTRALAGRHGRSAHDAGAGAAPPPAAPPPPPAAPPAPGPAPPAPRRSRRTALSRAKRRKLAGARRCSHSASTFSALKNGASDPNSARSASRPSTSRTTSSGT